jgi:hypothetical protein
VLLFIHYCNGGIIYCSLCPRISHFGIGQSLSISNLTKLIEKNTILPLFFLRNPLFFLLTLGELSFGLPTPTKKNGDSRS